MPVSAFARFGPSRRIVCRLVYKGRIMRECHRPDQAASLNVEFLHTLACISTPDSDCLRRMTRILMGGRVMARMPAGLTEPL